MPKPEERARTREKLGQFSTRFAVVGGDHAAIPEANRMLPLAFEATDGSLMLLRRDTVVDTTKFNDSEIHKSQYASLLMYTPWHDESVHLGAAQIDAELCSRMFNLHRDSIESVRSGCLDLL